jgi:hypothetical protein
MNRVHHIEGETFIVDEPHFMAAFAALITRPFAAMSSWLKLVTVRSIILVSIP